MVSFAMPFFTILFGVWLANTFLHPTEFSVAPPLFGIVGFVVGLPLPIISINFLVCGENSIINRLYENFLDSEKERQRRLQHDESNKMEIWRQN